MGQVLDHRLALIERGLNSRFGPLHAFACRLARFLSGVARNILSPLAIHFLLRRVYYYHGLNNCRAKRFPPGV